MSEPGPTWEKINGLVYGQCINCNARKWRLVKTGKFYSHPWKKVPIKARQCINCKKFIGEKWWVGLIIAIFGILPSCLAIVYFFPDRVKYPYYIDFKVFLIIAPLMWINIQIVCFIVYNFFNATKIVDPPT